MLILKANTPKGALMLDHAQLLGRSKEDHRNAVIEHMRHALDFSSVAKPLEDPCFVVKSAYMSCWPESLRNPDGHPLYEWLAIEMLRLERLPDALIEEGPGIHLIRVVTHHLEEPHYHLDPSKRNPNPRELIHLSFSPPVAEEHSATIERGRVAAEKFQQQVAQELSKQFECLPDQDFVPEPLICIPVMVAIRLMDGRYWSQVETLESGEVEIRFYDSLRQPYLMRLHYRPFLDLWRTLIPEPRETPPN